MNESLTRLVALLDRLSDDQRTLLEPLLAQALHHRFPDIEMPLELQRRILALASELGLESGPEAFWGAARAALAETGITVGALRTMRLEVTQPSTQRGDLERVLGLPSAKADAPSAPLGPRVPAGPMARFAVQKTLEDQDS